MSNDKVSKVGGDDELFGRQVRKVLESNVVIRTKNV